MKSFKKCGISNSLNGADYALFDDYDCHIEIVNESFDYEDDEFYGFEDESYFDGNFTDLLNCNNVTY